MSPERLNKANPVYIPFLVPMFLRFSVPSVLNPVIQSFNACLQRIGSDHDSTGMVDNGLPESRQLGNR